MRVSMLVKQLLDHMDKCIPNPQRSMVNETYVINTLGPRQHGRHFADDTFKRIFLNENVIISIKISLKSVPRGPVSNIPASVQIMAWRRPGDKPLSEPMMVSLPTDICVTRPQWVNWVGMAMFPARGMLHFPAEEASYSEDLICKFILRIHLCFTSKYYCPLMWYGYEPTYMTRTQSRPPVNFSYGGKVFSVAMALYRTLNNKRIFHADVFQCPFKVPSLMTSTEAGKPTHVSVNWVNSSWPSDAILWRQHIV